MADVYTALAVNCPALCIPATPLRLYADPVAATTYELFAASESGDASLAKMNRNLLRGDALGRHPGGLYGILEGFDVLIGSGLNVYVQQGTLCMDGPVQLPLYPVSGLLPTQQSFACSDNAYNWIFVINRTGQLGKVTSATASPVPAIPWTEWVFLKRVKMTSGAATEFDASGVFYLGEDRTLDGQGLCWQRRTADVGPPTDTPSSRVRFHTRTLSGLYLWDGARHIPLSENTDDLVLAGTAQYVKAHGQRAFFKRHTVRGRSVIRGYVRVRA